MKMRRLTRPCSVSTNCCTFVAMVVHSLSGFFHTTPYDHCHTTGHYVSSSAGSSWPVQSLSQSAKLECKRSDSVRTKNRRSRSLVAQYTHRSPTLSFWCPLQSGFGQGTSSRISQATHFLSICVSSREP